MSSETNDEEHIESGVQRPATPKAPTDEFAKLDRIVRSAAVSFVEAAIALQEIKARELYTGAYDSFEQYYEGIHEISLSYGQRLIEAGQVYLDMLPIVQIDPDLPLPTTESQLSALARIREPAARNDLYMKVARDAREAQEPPSAGKLEEAIDEGLTQEQDTTGGGASEAILLLNDLENRLNSGKPFSEILQQLRQILQDTENR